MREDTFFMVENLATGAESVSASNVEESEDYLDEELDDIEGDFEEGASQLNGVSRPKKTKGAGFSKSRAQRHHERIQALLDAEDESVNGLPDSKGQEKAGSSFSELFANSLQEQEFRQGDIVKGRVLSVQDDFVLIDINYKSEGLLNKSEFQGDSKELLEVGAEVSVYIEKIENENGMVVLSKSKADALQAWDNISIAAERGDVVEGTVVSKVKGGLSVDIGVKAFLPGSQIDLRPVRNLSAYVGKKFAFKVIKFNKKTRQYCPIASRYVGITARDIKESYFR